MRERNEREERGKNCACMSVHVCVRVCMHTCVCVCTGMWLEQAQGCLPDVSES